MKEENAPLAARAGDKNETKHLRVKLPIEVILRLQEIRILEGRSVTEVVQAALLEYFERELPPKKR